MPYPFDRSPVLRLNPWLTDVPETVAAERPRGADGKRSRRPHADMKVAQVRQLIEQTTLTYGQIAAKTGVGRASICRWTRDQGWKRPPWAPVATDTVPRPRAGRKLKLRLLAERLAALAERHVRELEQAPQVDPDKLMAALQIIKMARLEAMGRRHRRTLFGATLTGQEWWERQQAIRAALAALSRGGVDIDRAPQEALDLALDAHAPEKDHPALHPRGWRRR